MSIARLVEELTGAERAFIYIADPFCTSLWTGSELFVSLGCQSTLDYNDCMAHLYVSRRGVVDLNVHNPPLAVFSAFCLNALKNARRVSIDATDLGKAVAVYLRLGGEPPPEAVKLFWGSASPVYSAVLDGYKVSIEPGDGVIEATHRVRTFPHDLFSASVIHPDDVALYSFMVQNAMLPPRDGFAIVREPVYAELYARVTLRPGGRQASMTSMPIDIVAKLFKIVLVARGDLAWVHV